MTPEEFVASLEPVMRHIEEAARQALLGAQIRDSALIEPLDEDAVAAKTSALVASNDQLGAAIRHIRAHTERIEAMLRKDRA
jgi:hypothetical protein